MEGSKSEAVFDSLNLNPQLFINETLNTVDDLVDDAFDFYLQQASTALKTEGTDRSQDLVMGISGVRTLVQSVLDKRLAMWEKYCVNHCFAVPEGFSLPSNDESPADTSINNDCLYDVDLDAKLDSLRNKLFEARKESAVLNQELRALERQTASSNSQVNFVNDALQLYEQNSVHEMFQEMMEAASELRAKIGKLKKRRMEESKLTRVEKVYRNPDISEMSHHKGSFIMEFHLTATQTFRLKINTALIPSFVIQFGASMVQSKTLTMAKSISRHQQSKTKRDRARAIARQFESQQSSIRKKVGIAENHAKPSNQIMKLCITRAQPCKFGISFIIPDRVATEINDKKKISGSHPLRITRIPSGGPMEFHNIVEEAEKVSPPSKIQLLRKRPNPKIAYNRSCLNDWHPQVFHYTSDH